MILQNQSRDGMLNNDVSKLCRDSEAILGQVTRLLFWKIKQERL